MTDQEILVKVAEKIMGWELVASKESTFHMTNLGVLWIGQNRNGQYYGKVWDPFTSASDDYMVLERLREMHKSSWFAQEYIFALRQVTAQRFGEGYLKYFDVATSYTVGDYTRAAMLTLEPREPKQSIYGVLAGTAINVDLEQNSDEFNYSHPTVLIKAAHELLIHFNAVIGQNPNIPLSLAEKANALGRALKKVDDASGGPGTTLGYLPMACRGCGRMRLEYDGKEVVCEKCHWNYTRNEYVLPQNEEPESGVTINEP